MHELGLDALVDWPAVRTKFPDIPDSTIRVWANRGEITVRGFDGKGRALYRWGDLRDRIEARRKHLAEELARRADLL